MAKIFISYRREDGDVAAGRLGDDLSEIFGSESIFRDVDALEPGVNYEAALSRALNSCLVLIAIIGPQWSIIRTKQGSRRLDDPEDWVRVEIGRALAQGIRVIPVLISGAMLPGEADVPPDLKPLLKLQTCELSDRHWKADLGVLSTALEKIPGIAKHASPLTPPSATGRVNVMGSKQWFLYSPSIVVFIDGKGVTSMKLTDEKSLNLEAGTHTIFGKWSFRTTNTVTFDLQRGGTKSFSFIANRITGGLSIEPL